MGGGIKTKELIKNIKKLKTETYKKILYRLVNIYKNECRFSEGDLGYDDLYFIYFLLEREENVKDQN